jgi:hypothetical protein
MSSNSNTSIAKKARTKAEADFATWLMMAKEGKVIIRRRLKRRFVIGFFRKLPARLVGLEEMRVVASLVALKASHNDLGSRCSAVIVTAASQRRSADAPNRS